MGDWSYEPYGTDESADWFAVFWREKDFGLVIRTIEDFDPGEEAFEELRAAAYVAAAFGDPFTWPSAYEDKRKPVLEKALALLTTMIEADDPWGFIDAWGSRKVVPAVEVQIEALRGRLKKAA